MQPMGKTSKLFLESEIKRILNLNERIETSNFIIENVTAELQKSLDGLEKFLVDQLTIEPSLVGVDKNAKGVDEVKPFIDNIIYNNLVKPKKYCGGRGMVECEDLVNFFHHKLTQKGNINSIKNITDFYNTFKRDLDDLKGDSFKLKEFIKMESGKDVKLNPYTLTEDEIDNYIGFFEGSLKGLESRGIEVNFDSLNKIKDRLKNGTICADGKKTYCETEQEVEDVLKTQLTSVRGMLKQLQKTLSPQEISDKLDLFDRKLSPILVKNQGEEWAEKMRKSFSSMMGNGSICPSCETKDEVLDAVNREMAEMKKYSISGEKEAVEKMSNFLERAGNAHQIYKDFMDMWGLSDSNFGDINSKDSKSEHHTFSDGEMISFKIDPINDRRELNNKLTNNKGNFSDLILRAKVKSGGRGPVKHWVFTKDFEKEHGTIGFGIPTDKVNPDVPIKVLIQKNMTSPGKGEKYLITQYQ